MKRREAELATRYGPKHPQMINVKAELRDIGAAIAVELRKRVAALANDAEVARARETALTLALSDVEDRSVDLNRASVGLRQLEREADASRRIYEDVLARYKETTEQQNVLLGKHCTLAQGYKYYKPMTKEQLLELAQTV